MINGPDPCELLAGAPALNRVRFVESFFDSPIRFEVRSFDSLEGAWGPFVLCSRALAPWLRLVVGVVGQWEASGGLP